MSDTTPDRAWAGRVLFPRSAAELRSTTICPACFTPLTSTVCRSCGLDLGHAAAADLAASSTAIADALDARLDLIGRIRRETAAAALAAPAAPPVPAAAAQAAAVDSALVAPPASTPAVPPATPAAPTGVDGPRRSGIQIALIVVGISLLSVFAVFGLVYAFVTYGSEVRMAIIIGGTLATMVAAGVLARRGLGSTAEGVAALGTVMLVLDAWALRLNDPAGLGSTPEALYWGTALLIVGATAALWSRTNRLATPGVVGAGLLPIGAALVTLHAVRELLPAIGAAPETAAALAALIVAAGAWAIVPSSRPIARRAARTVALIVGAVAATAALPLLIELDPGARYSPVVAGLVLAAGALLHVVTLAPELRAAAASAGTTLVLSALGGGAALAAVVGAVVSAARFEQDRVIVSAPLIAAVIIGVLAEQGWRRSAAGSPWRTALAAATLTATALTAVAGGLAAIVASAAFVEAGTQGLEVIPLGVGAPVASGDPATVAALGALALSLGLIAASWASLGVLERRARALTLIAAIVLVATVPLLPAWWAVMAANAVLALGGAAALHAANRIEARDARRALIALCIPLSTGAALGAFVTAWAVPRGWVVGLLIALLAIGIARPTTTVIGLRAVFVGTAAALVLGSMPELAGDLARAVPALQLSPGSAVIAGAAVIIASSQLGRLAALEQRVVGIIAVLAAIGASTSVTLPAADEAVTAGLLTAALALVALRAHRIERLVALALLPFVVARGVVLAVDGGGIEPALVAAIALGALVIIAVVALLVAPRTPESSLDARARSARSALAGPGVERIVGDAAGALTGLVIVADAATRSADPGLLFVPVLVLAVLALVTAISRDGLIGSTSPRRFVGWVALGLATIALWMRLADAGERASEPYVLPLAGAMLLIVAAGALLGRRRGAAPSRTAAPLTAAALLVALVPSAAQSADGTDARGIVVALVAVALAIVPLLAERRIDERLPGMSGALVGTGLTALGLLALAHALDLLLTANGSALTGAALLRAALVVLVPSAVAVAARVLAEGRLRDIATIAALGTAALSAGALGLTGAVEPVELVSLPLALAAIAIGTMHLDAVPAARSWPWLGPGMAVLLVPSLLAIDAAGEPLWRAVALGVAAASVFAGGLWRRLQAPFVIGGTVLLVHLLVQSWPLLDLVGRSVEWWLWLGLAGVLIIVIAARFERRVQNVRDTATRIAQLR
ncbi:SCO7613 C-terminal domain-containing membrane protein [Microcella humidisoli]|uniref:DUF2157 domain-containing protein n=1 Tax=Microcella humidisoli TaxID=2963406 RepID=A0ABY5FUL1_9MICO|nr:hypothetical protein [Microcella humidisoli]UTT61933.1 hypothetical protein NNL39_09650 [Microcella humidisoli]